MRLQIVAAVLLISASNPAMPIVQAATPSVGVDGPMRATRSSLRDRYRPLLVFAPSDKDERFLRQVRLFASGSFDLRERQVLYVPLVLKSEASSWGVLLNSGQLAEFQPSEALASRRQFGVAPREFTVILIGKDGGEKFRAHAPVTIERLNAVIDAMPMRQQEVLNGNTK